MLYSNIDRFATPAAPNLHHLVSARMLPARCGERSAEAAVFPRAFPAAPNHPAYEALRGSCPRLTGRHQTGLMARPENGFASHGINAGLIGDRAKSI